jgi:ribosome-binding protein aMBF1 (putative translation factor)
MADDTTRLVPLKKGKYWRVQIKWLSGATRQVGKFDSELEALEWINTHPGYATVPTGIIPRRRTKRRFRPPTKNSYSGFSAKGLEKLGIDPRSVKLSPMATRNGPKFLPEDLVSLLKNVGDNIRRRRVAAGLSQDALAERVEVDRGYISLVENGRVNLTMKMLWKFAIVLEVKASQLLHRRFIDP